MTYEHRCTVSLANKIKCCTHLLKIAVGWRFPFRLSNAWQCRSLYICILRVFDFSTPPNTIQLRHNTHIHHKTTMKICLYQLLFVVSLFVVVVQSTDVSEEAVVAVVTSTTRKPYLRSLWDTWTANSSPSTNVGTTNANNAQEQSVSRCSLCHDGSYPKNPNHGVST